MGEMYLVHLSTVEQNTEGSVKLYPDQRSVFQEGKGRVARTGALDGTSVLVANGFTVADLNIIVRASGVSQTICDQLWTLHQSETTFQLACEIGHFFGAIDLLKLDRGEVKLSFVVQEEDSA